MSCGSSIGSGTAFSQAMVSQGPRFDRKYKKKRRENQVIGKAGIIRPDRRYKVKYL